MSILYWAVFTSNGENYNVFLLLHNTNISAPSSLSAFQRYRHWLCRFVIRWLWALSHSTCPDEQIHNHDYSTSVQEQHRGRGSPSRWLPAMSNGGEHSPAAQPLCSAAVHGSVSIKLSAFPWWPVAQAFWINAMTNRWDTLTEIAVMILFLGELKDYLMVLLKTSVWASSGTHRLTSLCLLVPGRRSATAVKLSCFTRGFVSKFTWEKTASPGFLCQHDSDIN